jgi:leucyl-tRNA synthetase
MDTTENHNTNPTGSGVRKYNPAEIEPKWQKIWDETGQNHAREDDPRPKFYNLVMFPYPSGDLHIGHWYNFTGVDVYGRFMRQNGYNVMQPLGFDAFGLPAENAAIKRGVQAHKWTLDNIENMRRQLKTMGGIWDWEREVITCNPEYYKWTEWFFLKLYEAGLAYRAKAPVWWCPNDQTVLANEQVKDGRCERCDAIVIKRDLVQWFFRITKYADRLLDFKDLDWPESTRLKQTNWIGRSEGARVNFTAQAPDGQVHEIPVFTTRPDTIFGVTFFLLAPEHPLVEQLTTPEQKAQVAAYVDKARRETEIERQSTDKEKSGIFIGSYVTNPVTGKQIPIWITDYVLMTYGTGAVMGVPAHDQRDFEFARKFELPIVMVYQPDGQEIDPNTMSEALVHQGHVVNSGQFNGLPDGDDTIKQFINHIEQNGWGKAEINYRLRDWLISRQRYWGAPIPMIYCETDGIVPVPESQLPVWLPEEVEFKPSGESPLKYIDEFVNTTCPKCGGPATRETDTMDTFMCSSWYFLRYPNAHYDEAAFDPAMMKKWMPVDQYTGGPEHATMHLLYARFFTMALHDMGYLDFEEPFQRLFHQGMILSEGRKMSKSRGKTIAPDRLVAEYGADAVRAFLMFLGPYDRGADWNDNTEQLLTGVARFLSRVWTMTLESPRRQDGAGANVGDESADTQVRRMQHKTIKRVVQDLRAFQFNTVLSGLMEFLNELQKISAATPTVKNGAAWAEALDTMLILLSPLSPHITEELWHEVGHTDSVHAQSVPVFDPALAADDVIKIVLQVNGKLRDTIEVPAGTNAEEIQAQAMSHPKIVAQLNGNQPKKVVYVPGKLVNVVI